MSSSPQLITSSDELFVTPEEAADEQNDCLSKRILTSFGINRKILTKLKAKGFRLKSDIEDISDSTLQSICGLNPQQMDLINKQIRNSHKTPLQYTSVFQRLKSPNARIKTSSKSMDIALKGGLEVSRITQISGEGGVGKTQICMQLCINVQMPKQFGGLSAQSLYIDTENNFRPERIVSMAKHWLSKEPKLKQLISVESIKSGIHLRTCNTNSKHLVDLVVNQIEPFIDRNPQIKLIVIDSIAQLFRYDYKGSENQRDYELALIGHKLKVLAHSKKMAVLIANQVTFSTKDGKNIPCLGKLWQTLSSTSILLKRMVYPIRLGSLLHSIHFESTQRFYIKITENGVEEGMTGIEKLDPSHF